MRPPRLTEDQVHNPNDDRYDQFLPAAVDLIAGLAEWREALELSEQENQSGGQS